ncbi:hypothetical protein HBB16_00030 [Pseudonocardia sp. MCCB 268]|nr:hypothetical protein [Pseudonocardia cytotoxica]
MGLISSAAAPVDQDLELFDAFERCATRRPPNSAERDRISRQATFATRASSPTMAKPAGVPRPGRRPDAHRHRRRPDRRRRHRTRRPPRGRTAGVQPAGRDRDSAGRRRRRKSGWTRAIDPARSTPRSDYLSAPDGDALAEL